MHSAWIIFGDSHSYCRAGYTANSSVIFFNIVFVLFSPSSQKAASNRRQYTKTREGRMCGWTNLRYLTPWRERALQGPRSPLPKVHGWSSPLFLFHYLFVRSSTMQRTHWSVFNLFCVKATFAAVTHAFCDPSGRFATVCTLLLHRVNKSLDLWSCN